MEQSENLYVLGIGPEEAFEEGRAGLHYEQDEAGQKALPVFPTSDGADAYALALLNNPASDTDARGEMEEGRFRAIHLEDGQELGRMVQFMGVDYVKWIPAPGEPAQFYRIPK
jgi:hypothetical protein